MKEGNPFEHWVPKTEEEINEILDAGHRIPSMCLGLPVKTKQNTLITIYQCLLKDMERRGGGLVYLKKGPKS